MEKQVLDNLRPQACGGAGVARHVGDDDLLLVLRVLADGAFKHRLLAVADAVFHILGVIPASDPEMGAPAGQNHFLAGSLLPFPIPLKLKPHIPRLVRHQREELRRNFQDPAIHGVECEGDDLIARHLHRWGRILALWLHLPPLARRKRIERRIILAERHGGVTACREKLCCGTPPENERGYFEEESPGELHFVSRGLTTVRIVRLSPETANSFRPPIGFTSS